CPDGINDDQLLLKSSPQSIKYDILSSSVSKDDILYKYSLPDLLFVFPSIFGIVGGLLIY
ncbi:unnamed protein product, partial [marine sediment metagenome]